MCLGIPGKIEEVKGAEAIVSFGGTRRSVRLDLLDDASVGDYVIVHAGFAIEILDQETALQMLNTLREVFRE
ncbi:MAG: HypC/HybG/HupF family hydrogenase formation chaperone [Thermoproteota archaeon]